MQRKKQFLQDGGDLFITICGIVVILLTAVVLYPLIYVFSASFSSASAVSSGRMWLWPVDITLEGYKYVLQYRYVWIGYRNTILYSLVGTTIGLAITMACAYPLARNKLRGRNFFTLLFTVTMVFNGGMIPNYILMQKLGMINTVWAMILPGCMSVYNMIVAKSFIQSSIPGELLEASKIDGCSDAKFFFRIVLPLSRTILAVLGIMYMSSHWNAYFNAFLYLKDRDLFPLQLFLRQILVQSNFDSQMLDPEAVAQMQTLQMLLKYSVIVIATAPMLCLFPFFQKYFDKGILIGSLKG